MFHYFDMTNISTMTPFLSVHLIISLGQIPSVEIPRQRLSMYFTTNPWPSCLPDKSHQSAPLSNKIGCAVDSLKDLSGIITNVCRLIDEMSPNFPGFKIGLHLFPY